MTISRLKKSYLPGTLGLQILELRASEQLLEPLVGELGVGDGSLPFEGVEASFTFGIASCGKQPIEFDAVVRIDTPGEADYYRNGGILQYVLRSLV